MKKNDTFMQMINEAEKRDYLKMKQRYVRIKLDTAYVFKTPIYTFLSKHHITLAEFAELCNVDYVEICKLLDREIKIDTVFKIEKKLGLQKGTLIYPSKELNIVFFD